MSDGDYITELWMEIAEDTSFFDLEDILNLEYEDLMELEIFNNFNKLNTTEAHIKFACRAEIAPKIRQMCINLYEGKRIKSFDFVESFMIPCDIYDNDLYEEDKLNGDVNE